MIRWRHTVADFRCVPNSRRITFADDFLTMEYLTAQKAFLAMPETAADNIANLDKKQMNQMPLFFDRCLAISQPKWIGGLRDTNRRSARHTIGLDWIWATTLSRLFPREAILTFTSRYRLGQNTSSCGDGSPKELKSNPWLIHS